MFKEVLQLTGNAELLNYTFQNAEMGVETLEQLIDIVEDEEMVKQLKKQHEEYDSIFKACKSLIKAHGEEEKGIGSYNRMKTYLMINLQTIADKSASHIAEMLIIGSNMGMIQAIKNLRKYSNAHKDILCLVQRLLEHEEDNIQALKAFL